MKIRKIEKERTAFLGLFYGETGVGKTYTTITTSPTPILYIQIEPRLLETCLGSTINQFSEEQLTIIEPENFTDLFNFLSDPTNIEKITSKYKVIVVDSLSYLAQILLSEIEEETGKAEVFDTKRRPLTNYTRTDLAGYGAVSGWLKRFTKLLGNYVTRRIPVICLSIVMQDPRFDSSKTYYPAMVGREYPIVLPSYFDIIGYIVPNSPSPYPPKVLFDSDGSFLAKWVGNRKNIPNIYSISNIIDSFSKD